MNLHLWTLIAWVVLILAPFATGGLCWHYGRIEGRHEGRCMEKERELARRHRAELRVPYEGPEIRAKTGPLSRVPPPLIVSEDPASLAYWRSLNHTTAADLAPVIVPEPGTHKPQPGGTGPHTTRMPALTDTGELRALTAQTDAWLEGMRQKGLIA